MGPRLAADLDMPAPRPLGGAERDRALRSHKRTIASLCEGAGIRFRVTGGKQPRVAFWDGPGHGYTVTDDNERLYLVDRTGLPRQNPDRALRALEILAYCFQEYSARETVCGRGYFVYPLTPEHGRLWLSEIGRRGGRSSSERKASASRRNLQGLGGRSHS